MNYRMQHRKAGRVWRTWLGSYFPVGVSIGLILGAGQIIGLEWNPPPCPEHSWLYDWYLGFPVPFFHEVHEELMSHGRHLLLPEPISQALPPTPPSIVGQAA